MDRLKKKRVVTETLEDTEIVTAACGTRLRIKPGGEGRVWLHFGIDTACMQAAGEKDILELIEVFGELYGFMHTAGGGPEASEE